MNTDALRRDLAACRRHLTLLEEALQRAERAAAHDPTTDATAERIAKRELAA